MTHERPLIEVIRPRCIARPISIYLSLYNVHFMKGGGTSRPRTAFIVAAACLGFSITYFLIAFWFVIMQPQGFYTTMYQVTGWLCCVVLFTSIYLVVRWRSHAKVNRTTAAIHLLAGNIFIIPVLVLSYFKMFVSIIFVVVDCGLFVLIWLRLSQYVKHPPPNQRVGLSLDRAAFLLPVLTWPAPIYLVILELFAFGWWIARHPWKATHPDRHLLASILVASGLVMSPLVIDPALVKPAYRLEFSFDVPGDVPETIIPYIENSNIPSTFPLSGSQSTLGGFRMYHLQARQDSSIFTYNVASMDVVRYVFVARCYASGLNLTYWKDSNSMVQATIEKLDGTIIKDSSGYYGSSSFLNQSLVPLPVVTPHEESFAGPIFFVQVRFSYGYSCGSLCGGFWDDEAWFLVGIDSAPDSPYTLIMALIGVVGGYLV